MKKLKSWLTYFVIFLITLLVCLLCSCANFSDSCTEESPILIIGELPKITRSTTSADQEETDDDVENESVEDNNDVENEPVDNNTEVFTGIFTHADISYYRSIVTKGESSNTFLFEDIDIMTPEIALELVMGVLCMDGLLMDPILVPCSDFSEGSRYEYIIQQVWMGEMYRIEAEQRQLLTRKVACFYTFPDYYEVNIYEFFIDDFNSMAFHGPIVQVYIVSRLDNTIIETNYIEIFTSSMNVE